MARKNRIPLNGHSSPLDSSLGAAVARLEVARGRGAANATAVRECSRPIAFVHVNKAGGSAMIENLENCCELRTLQFQYRSELAAGVTNLSQICTGVVIVLFSPVPRKDCSIDTRSCPGQDRMVFPGARLCVASMWYQTNLSECGTRPHRDSRGWFVGGCSRHTLLPPARGQGLARTTGVCVALAE